MKRTSHDGETVFLKHRFPLSENRIVKLVLPVDLTPQEANRLQDFINALVLDPDANRDQWPYAITDDPEEFDNIDDWDEDLDEDEDEDEDEDDYVEIVLTEADLEWPSDVTPANAPAPGVIEG